MDRTADAALGSARLAFWGYTNSCGATAALALARKLHACEAVIDGRAEITRFFYETPGPIDDLMILAVRGAGGSLQWDGGLHQLATALPSADRGFDAIICESFDRIGRNAMRVLGRERLVAEPGATILCAAMVDLGTGVHRQHRPAAGTARHAHANADAGRLGAVPRRLEPKRARGVSATAADTGLGTARTRYRSA